MTRRVRYDVIIRRAMNRGAQMSCELIRIETSTDNPPRKCYVCSCGAKGYWQSDGWRHGSNGANWYTAEKLLEWNWRVHAGNMGKRRPRRSPEPTLPAAPIMRFDLERIAWDRLAKWLRDAEDLHGYCAANGIAIPSPLARFTETISSASIPANITPGVTVEWDPEHASGTMRGRVTRVSDGRVFVEIRPASRRKPATETWFEPDEVHRLRAVVP